VRLDRGLPWRHGLRERFLPVLVVFVILSMAVLGTSLYFSQRQITLDRFEQDTRNLRQVLRDKGNAYSTFLARIAPQGILSHDYLLLEAYAEELSSDPDVVYAVILNRADKPITHFLKKHVAPREAATAVNVEPGEFTQSLARARADTGLLIVKREINYNEGTLGSVEVGLSQAKIAHSLDVLKADLDKELRHIATLTGSGILIALVVLILLSVREFNRLVARPIQALGAEMARVQAGDLGARAGIKRDDEIGWLAGSFNKMAADLQGHVDEIEQQRRVENETRDYLANILDNSADMICTTALDGSIVEFNAAAERVLGYRREEVVGGNSSIFYTDLEARQALYNLVLGGRPVQNTETRLRCKDGRLIDAELTISPLRDNAGALIGAVCIGRDVTQAKSLRQQLIQAEKMSTVGQVSAWIAHQIRNSLGRILLNASALRPDQDTTASRQQAHRDLTNTIAEMDRIVSDLLDYSRTLSLHPTRINLNSALGDLLASLSASGVNGHHNIERAFDPELPPIQIDVFKMEQALGNVLKNAIQAMPDRGTLRVETRRGPGERQVTVAIRDSGPGIPPENLRQVFRPFFTTKPGGTGLGLAIASRIVEAHGGSVSVESAAGRGTTFTFVLPETASR
jgi:PAS domain S-box-containing protein